MKQQIITISNNVIDSLTESRYDSNELKNTIERCMPNLHVNSMLHVGKCLEIHSTATLDLCPVLIGCVTYCCGINEFYIASYEEQCNLNVVNSTLRVYDTAFKFYNLNRRIEKILSSKFQYDVFEKYLYFKDDKRVFGLNSLLEVVDTLKGIDFCLTPYCSIDFGKKQEQIRMPVLRLNGDTSIIEFSTPEDYILTLIKSEDRFMPMWYTLCFGNLIELPIDKPEESKFLKLSF